MDGEEQDNFWSAAAQSEGAADLGSLTEEQSGWSTEASSYLELIDVYCDSNRNGFIDPDERHADNYIWDFGEAVQSPTIRCTANAGFNMEGG